MATTVEDQAGPPATTGWTWKKLLTVATVLAAVGTILTLVFAGFIPPLALFVLLWIVGLVLLRTKEKAGAILLLVVHVAHVALSLPFTIPILQVPASAVDFILTSFTLVTSLVGIAAAIPVMLGRGGETSPRMLASTATVVFLLASAYSIYATVTYDSDEAQGGDVQLTTQDIEFKPAEIQADEGTVSIFIDNKDMTFHTFTIESGPDVDVDIPAGKSVRVEFEAEQGEYEFYCVPHEGDMEGTLQIN
ncbi:MAG: cupredoxin domain-containing protein [Actinomycetota bacterium]|nr:cupredoxin domain-containing protein [Actinomycetota bacterium]